MDWPSKPQPTGALADMLQADVEHGIDPWAELTGWRTPASSIGEGLEPNPVVIPPPDWEER